MHTSKQIIQGVVKAGRASRNNLKYVLFANSANKNTNVNLHSSFNRYFTEETQKYEKVTSYESLISRICNASNVNDLFNIMDQNIGLYKNEHIVLTLRVLARLIKTSNVNAAQAELLQNDQRYINLAAKAQESLHEFNEYEILDFIFWLRRFKIAKLPLHIKDEALDKLFQKVQEFVKSKSFNFRNLVNLYYDLSCLRKNTDLIIDEIYNELKADFKLLTPFTIVQILQAASRKAGSASAKEYFVVDYVQRNLDPMLQEFDNDQKCLVFKYLADMELNLNPPGYTIPGVLYKIKTQLKENLDQLSELGVLNILDAYTSLPKEFHSDLLDEIKEMVIVTIQHNSENIKSFFLLDFLEKNLAFSRGRKLVEEEIITIYEEIANRVLADEFMGKFRVVERIVNIYDKVGIKYEPLLDSIVERIGQANKFFSGKIIRSLLHHKKDVSAIVEKFLNQGGLDTADAFQRMQLFLILSELKNPQFEEAKQKIKAGFLETPNGLIRSCNFAAELQQADQELFDKLIETLKPQAGKGNEFGFWKNVLSTINSKNSRQIWVEWLRDSTEEFRGSSIYKFVDAFFSLEQINTERAVFFMSFFDRVPVEKIPYRTIILHLKKRPEFIQEVSKIEFLFNKFFNSLVSAMEKNPDDLRLGPIYSFIKRLESLNVRSSTMNKMLSLAYNISKSSGKPISAKLELHTAIHLIDHSNYLQGEHALEIYKGIKGKRDENRFGSKLYSYYLSKSNTDTLQNEEVKAEIEQRVEGLVKNLNETGAKTLLNTVADLLSFPPQFLEAHKEQIVKALKSSLNFGTAQHYQEVLHAIPSNYVRHHFDFYAPILKELIINYTNFNKKFTPKDIVPILKKFADFRSRNPTIYNNILADVARMFHAFKNEELVDIAISFSRIKIKQTDLFDKILSKIAAQPHKFMHLIKGLFIELYLVGAISPQAKVSISEIVEETKNVQRNLLASALYGSILDFENEAEFFEKIFSKLDGEFRFFPTTTLAAFGEYLRVAYPNKPEYVETLKKISPKYDAEVATDFQTSPFLNRMKTVLGTYLDVMKVEYKTDFSANGIPIDIYLPGTQQIVKVFVTRDVNFDRSSLTGRGTMIKKIYNSLEGYTPIFINLKEFTSIPDHINRINYLIASGIKSNEEGKYDLSKLPSRGGEEAEEVAEESSQEETITETSEEEEVAKSEQ